MATKKKTTAPVKQICLFLLDKSGSMNTIRTQAIEGFNEYIKTLKKNHVDMDFTLTLFDTFSIETPYNHVTMQKVNSLNEEAYHPNGGTPLYDAVIEAIEKLAEYVEEMPKIAVSVVIMTDGEENSSREHNEHCLRDLVDHLTKESNWTFAYMGANQDAWNQAAKIGILRGNTTSWQTTAGGTSKAFRTLANSTVQYSASMMDMAANGSDILRSANYFSKTGEGEK